jgi:hypothetical protein
MTVRKEALRVDDQLAIAARSDDRPDSRRRFFRQPAAGGNHRDAHRRSL